MAQIIVDTSALEELQSKLANVPSKVAYPALASAINRTLSYTLTQTAKVTSAEYTLSQKKIKSGASIKKASVSSSPEGIVTFKGSPLRASEFPHKIAGNKNRSPVTLQIKRGAPKVSQSLMFGEGAGGSRGANGTREVYTRGGNSNAAQTVFTISVPEMIASTSVYSEIEEKAKAKLSERLIHELEWRLSNL